MITQAAINVFDQGLTSLQKLSNTDYNTKFELVYNGTIGGHFRHILEHFTILAKSVGEPEVNYDLRIRDEQLETNKQRALDVTLEMRNFWNKVSDSELKKGIILKGKLCSQQSETSSAISSLERELAYSIAHAHHHYAIIGVMCGLLNSPVAQDFGIAPSTIEYRKSQKI